MRQPVRWLLALLSAATVIAIVVQAMPSPLNAALMMINPTAGKPVTGIFFSLGYEAQPNERGSVVLETAEALTAFEGMELTLAVDPAKASLVRVRRTAATQQFSISLDFPGPGVARVALVGPPRDVAKGLPLLEVELQLARSTVNTVNDRIALRLIDVAYLVGGDRIRTDAHDGRITVTGTQDALTIPFTPHVADVDPGVLSLVSRRPLVIRGKNLPDNPRVLLGNQPLPVLSASATEVIATVPESTMPGTYTVSLDSLLADEEVVIRDAPGTAGAIDILEKQLFINPNPVLRNADRTSAGIVLWIPVFNPLGSDDPLIGTADLSAIGGDPNVAFEGVGSPAVGAGGRMVNWFRVPAEGEFALPASVETNQDYPIALRVENRSGSRDDATAVLNVRQQLSRGDAPAFGAIETVPSPVFPGDDVTFVVNVTDPDGVSTLQHLSIRLTTIGGTLQSLEAVLDIPTGGSVLTQAAYATDFTLPKGIVPGTYPLELRAVDSDGNEAQTSFSFTVRERGTTGGGGGGGGTGGGAPPAFRDVRFVPETVEPGAKVRLFAEVADQNGVKDVTVIADFTELRLDVEELEDLIDFPSGTVVTQNTFASDRFTVPDDLQPGVYELLLRAVDETGNDVRTTVFLRVQRGGADEGQAPRIDVARSFQVPRVFGNDNEAIGELHVFVSDPDDDVLTVIANFGGIGRATSASVSGSDGIDLFCNESAAIVCLAKGVPDSLGNRWFVLEGIAVPGTTLPSADPYMVELTAIDAEGHTDSTVIPVLVGGPGTLADLQVPPAFELLVPVSDRELELVLTTPVDTGSIDRGGSQFVIQSSLDAFTTAAVRRVSWDATGRYLYLQTDPLNAGETYALRVASEAEGVKPLADRHGNRFARDRGGSITFRAFRPPAAAPAIEKVTIRSQTEMDVRFTTEVLPSSIHPHLLPSRASITSLVTADARRVKGGSLQSDGRTLRLTVEALRAGNRYRLQIEDVLAPGLVAATLEHTFTATVPDPAASSSPIILPTADLDHDGDVDFNDFALFSLVYGTEYDLLEIDRLAEGIPALPESAPAVEEDANPDAAPRPRRDDPLGGGLPYLTF